ncbi:MAG: DUF4369 domain-containing protein [Pedobacter sp.]|nr:MAG: DUF4369 domain-containing protein [Pedobacter sp.]
MLRALLLLSTLFSFHLSIAQNAYSVKGTFKNPFQGNVYLIRGGEKDSAVVHDRSFSFQGETLLPTFSYFIIKSSKSIGLMPFYIGDGEVEVELDTLTKTGERKNGKFEVRQILFLLLRLQFCKEIAGILIKRHF